MVISVESCFCFYFTPCCQRWNDIIWFDTSNLGQLMPVEFVDKISLGSNPCTRFLLCKDIRAKVWKQKKKWCEVYRVFLRISNFQPWYGRHLCLNSKLMCYLLCSHSFNGYSFKHVPTRSPKRDDVTSIFLCKERIWTHIYQDNGHFEQTSNDNV